MKARNRTIPPNIGAEELFILGGEAMQPFYFQPGRDPEYDIQFPYPYLVPDSAIDEMSLAKQFPMPPAKIYERRDQISDRVRVSLPMAERIEIERSELARRWRQMVLRSAVDLKV